MDRSQYPLFLILPELGVKLHCDVSDDGDQFNLFVNGNSYFFLPYRYSKEELPDTNQAAESL